LNRIARGLHPAGLERLGLVASIRRYCVQLAHARRITIDLELDEVPPALDLEAALCLYRIVQEALHNVVKHSGASQATVCLTHLRGDLVLRVADRGVGFDPRATCLDDSLGLVSMRERARLAQARLRISSKPGGGTLVEARMPVRRSFAAVARSA
jgi:signal transduction histidine kinase